MKTVRRIMLILMCFTGIGALAGGIGFVLDPSGGNVGMSLTLLDHSPFSDYLVPGLLLLVVIGGGHLLAAYLSYSKQILGWSPVILAGGSLIVWISVQICMIGFISWLQPIYLLIGFTEVALGLLVRKYS